MEKFKDPHFRIEVYEHILKELSKMKGGGFKRYPFMCHIVAEKYKEELGGYTLTSEAMESLSGRLEPFVTYYGKTITPLHHILPELKRPDIDTFLSCWYVTSDIKSRIKICEEALETLKQKLS